MKKIKEEYCLVETYESTISDIMPELVKYMLGYLEKRIQMPDSFLAQSRECGWDNKSNDLIAERVKPIISPTSHGSLLSARELNN